MRYTLIITLLFLSISMQWVAAQQPQYARAKIQLNQTHAIEALQQLGVICHGHHAEGRHFTSDFSYAEIRAIEEAGYTVEILIEDVQKHYENINQQAVSRDNDCTNDADLAPTPENFELGSMGGYYTYAELLAELEQMHTLYPHLISTKAPISTDTLTHEGREVYWVRISDNPEIEEAEEPQVLYTALIHAREPGSMQQMVFYMWYLLENYDSDPEIQYLVNETNMYFIPCVNPDGYLYNESTNPNGGGLWRKNRRDNGNGTFGVDLNRNFGYSWGYDDVGSSTDPDSDTYRGPAAFSEPETQLLQSFIENHDIKICLNYHTFSELLLRPWSHITELPEDIATFDAFAEKMTAENGYEYGGSEVIGYTSNGDSDGYMYGAEGVFSLTPEVGTWFWANSENILYDCKINLSANLYAARFLLNYGSLKEASTNPPYLQNATGILDFNIKKYGLAEGALTVSLSSPHATIAEGESSYNLQHLEEQSLSFSYTLHDTIMAGDVVEFTATIDNGEYAYEQTFSKPFGAFDAGEHVFFSTNGNDMQGWEEATNWSITTEDYYSSPSSITDSPNDSYSDNTGYYLTLNNNIDLSNATNAYIRFHTKWNIEAEYDFCQLRASTDGNTFIPLCGAYTVNGSIYQDVNEPLWDGIQEDWVQEEISLQDFLGSEQLQVEFRLLTDNFINEDGFYFDDFVIVVENPNSTQTYNFEAHDFQVQAFPNPSSSQLTLKWEKNQQVDAISITNVLGQAVKQIAVPTTEQQVTIPSLAAGTYFYQLRSKGQTVATGKLIFE